MSLRARLTALGQRSAEALVAQDQKVRGPVGLDAGDLKLFGALVVALAVIVWVDTFGSSSKTRVLIPLFALFVDDGAELHRGIFFQKGLGGFFRYAYWSLNVLLAYALVPFVYARFVLGRTARDLGWSTQGAVKHWRIYIVLFALIAGPLLVASQLPGFAQTYPIYRGARDSLPRFLLWELVYLPQFIGVEFLFRGFLVFPFERRMGLYAVLLPLVPYAMIHFGKPWPEVFGALAAGLVLGGIAFVTRSLWLGVAIHVSVALSMDSLATLTRWWNA